MQQASRWRLVLVTLTSALVLMIGIDLLMGPADVSAVTSPSDVIHTLLSHVSFLRHSPSNLSEAARTTDTIVWELRMPRALAGVAIGMLLAMAGVAFQSFLMNPLADPYMVGVSAGSALGSSAVILAGGAGWMSGMAQPTAAFLAGLATMVFITLLARINGRLSAQTFLLAGFVLGTFVYSFTKLAVAIANRGNDTGVANRILTQLLGSLQTIEWRELAMLAPFGILGAVMLFKSVAELNLMSLGEESAAHLGVDTEAVKRRIIVSGSMVTAATVAVAGIIGFVGMVVPHLARRLVGPDHRRMLPISMLLGGLVLVIADWASRVYLNELEVGVVTSLVGAPVFCYLLRKRLVSRW